MKKILISLMAILMLSSIVSALNLDDLDIPDKMTIEEYLIENVEEITQMNLAELEGIVYEILVVGDKYIIVIIEGEVIVVLK
ncbi:MAG: hypothetical protein P9M11_10000 [Candidatus Tenebribacter burtonii]|nr:hypothetical protein [Candidatus Tenebribacter burtonii]